MSVTGDSPFSADHILIRKSEPPLKTTRPEGKNLHTYVSLI